MARRRKFQDEHDNVDRWLVSYADFITLLFAFFIVMYAVSSVNEGKYRVVAQYLGAAFSEDRKSLDPIQIGEPERGSQPLPAEVPLPAAATGLVEQLVQQVEPAEAAAEVVRDKPVEGHGPGSGDVPEMRLMQRISEQLGEVLAPYIDQDLIAVKREDVWIEIELKSGILFGSGVASLSADALPILKKLADILREIPGSVQVEGHTDNLPIQSPQFPSNWELSAARAANVVRQMVSFGVKPDAMAAIGYGEYQPVADNHTEEGRFKNRRVVLVLMSKEMARHQEATGDRARLLATTPAGPSQLH